jgi:hypothetical protein
MARKNKLEKTGKTGIKKLLMADGTYNFIAILSHNGTRYGEKNLTKLFGTSTITQAVERLAIIKVELSKGIDVFSIKSDKIDYLVTEYLNSRKKDYRKNSTATYNKHIKPIIPNYAIAKP